MSFFDKFRGYRWSIYFVQNGSQAVYFLHEHSVIRLLGCVMRYFKDCGPPSHPWSIHLNFNKTHESILLIPGYFNQVDHDISPTLMQKVKSIAPGFMVKGNEPVFMEAATNKVIPMRDSSISFNNIDLQAMIDNASKPKETNFRTIMREIFQQSK